MGFDFGSLYEKYVDETSIMIVVTVHKVLEAQVINVLNACVSSRKFPMYRQEFGDNYVAITATVKKKYRKMLEDMFDAFRLTNVTHNNKEYQACLGKNFYSAFSKKDMKGEACQ